MRRAPIALVAAVLATALAGAPLAGQAPDSLRADSLGRVAGGNAGTGHWFLGGLGYGTVFGASAFATLITGGAGVIVAAPLFIGGVALGSKASSPTPGPAADRVLGDSVPAAARRSFERGYVTTAVPRRRNAWRGGVILGFLATTGYLFSLSWYQ